MLSNRSAVLVTTALAPAMWGTTYLTTSEFLPPGRPLLAAAVRALPVGLVLVGLGRRLPRGSWWWRAAVLGALNIGVFFALLFVAAYRLPGGVAATLGAVQPLLVGVLAGRVLGEHPGPVKTSAALAGLAGVALLVLRSGARLDPVGIAAALGAAAAMAVGVVLTKRWQAPVPLVALTGWQLVAGGALLVPLALTVEGVPGHLTAGNVAGYLYLAVLGTGVAYALWFRGLRRLSATSVTFLGLLSPLVATALGWAVLGQTLTGWQILGAVVVIASVLVAQLQPRRTAVRPLREVGTAAGRL